MSSHTSLLAAWETNCNQICEKGSSTHNTFSQSDVMMFQNWEIGCVWKTPFCKSSHNCHLTTLQPDEVDDPTYGDDNELRRRARFRRQYSSISGADGVRSILLPCGSITAQKVTMCRLQMWEMWSRFMMTGQGYSGDWK